MTAKKKYLVVVFTEPLAVPDDLITDARRLFADVLANSAGELLVFFPDMRLTLCRSLYEKARRMGVPAKRGYRTKPRFTLHSGMDALAGKAYIYGAQRLNTRLMRFGRPVPDLACPWCGNVGQLTFYVPQKNVWAPNLPRSTTAACHHCHREATVEQHIPASHQHELVEWLQGIARVPPAYESAARRDFKAHIADKIANASTARRRKMGLGAKPGSNNKQGGPLARPAQGPRARTP